MKLINCISYVLLIMYSGFSQSTEYNNATISRLMIDSAHGNKVFIELAVPQAATAQCHQSSGWHYVLSLTDELSEKIYAMLLTSYASGKRGRFVGSNQCEVHDKIETLSRIELK